MPYKVIYDEAVSVLKKVGEFTNADGIVIGDDHTSIIYLPDAIIPDEEIAPTVIKQYDEGGKHIRSLLVRCDANGAPLDEMPKPEEEIDQIIPPTSNVSAEGTVKSGAASASMLSKSGPATVPTMQSGIEGGLEGSVPTSPPKAAAKK